MSKEKSGMFDWIEDIMNAFKHQAELIEALTKRVESIQRMLREERTDLPMPGKTLGTDLGNESSLEDK